MDENLLKRIRTMATILSESPYAHLEKAESITFMQDVADVAQYLKEHGEAISKDLASLVERVEHLDGVVKGMDARFKALEDNRVFNETVREDFSSRLFDLENNLRALSDRIGHDLASKPTTPA